jgi:flavin reductase (DIM6/NTAB) family NADH-FMN oxidoreductase RutF
MNATVHSYEPRNGHGLPHDPFSAIVGPRPIGWISSQDPQGQLNLAPYSFFNAFNYSPPIIGFASVGYKDTVRNIEATREFVWNLATHDLAQAMNETSRPLAPDQSEFTHAALTPLASQKVRPPRVGQSPVSMECRCTQIVQLQDAQGSAVPTWLVLGEVVVVHIHTALLKDGIYDTATAGHILRAGGTGDYFTVGPDQMFRMPRPR